MLQLLEPAGVGPAGAQTIRKHAEKLDVFGAVIFSSKGRKVKIHPDSS